MSELLQIYLLPPSFRTCFFYRNNINLTKERLDEVWGVKIRYGENFTSVVFGSVSLQPLAEVPDKCLGVPVLLANKLNMKNNDQVLMSDIQSLSITSLQIYPKNEEDYIILLSCKSFIEANLLNQVRIVSRGQILPVHVFSNFVIDVEVGTLQPQMESGQLERLTEVIILQKLEENLRNSEKFYNERNEINSDDEYSGARSNNLFAQLNCKLSSQVPSFYNEMPQISSYYDQLRQKKFESHTYRILPHFLIPDTIPKQTLEKFIIIPWMTLDLDLPNCSVPFSVKFLCKIYSCDNLNSSEVNESAKKNDKTNVKGVSTQPINTQSLYCYIISFYDSPNSFGRKNGVFCPYQIMRKLKLSVGSDIIIQKVKLEENNQIHVTPINTLLLSDTKKYLLWTNMKSIKENIKKTWATNIKFNVNVNSLILGGPGMGKSHLVKCLMEDCEKEFIFAKLINCKGLRGKKLEALCKILNENLTACCLHEPSLLILDDLHALTQFDETEEKHNKLYSNRIADMIEIELNFFLKKYSIKVIATALGLTELNVMVSTHGPRLFSKIYKLEDLSQGDRYEALKDILDFKGKQNLRLKALAEVTNGYTIRDLCDLVDKARMKCLVRKGDLNLDQEDFDSAFTESVPLVLRGINKKKTHGKQWHEIGGMESAKKALIEVFSWPSKYPDILESCPLRLQRGVLLYGSPGTGKTLLAGALAEACALNFVSVKGPELLSKYVGASEEAVRNLFLRAQKSRPCLLFFDEFDSLAPKRGHDSTGVTDRVVNQLLTQMDGVETLEGVWILAATSRPDLIDPALLRPGRLDKIIFCDLPDKTDRFSIMNVLSANLAKSADIELAALAEASDGYTGADLQAVLCSAQILAIKEANDNFAQNDVSQIVICQRHLMAAFADTKPSLSEMEKLRYRKIYEKFVNSRKKSGGKSYAQMSQKAILA